MKSILLLPLAVIAFLAGCVGLLIPVVPQVPFFAAAVVLASAGSRRVREWVKNTRLYRKYLEVHVRKNRFLSSVFYGIPS